MKKYFILFLIIPFLAMSCGNRNSAGKNDKEGDSLCFKYAKNISIVKHDGYFTVNMADPWNKGKILHSYTLVCGNGANPDDGSGATVVRIPLKRCVVATSVHCQLLRMIGAQGAVRGVCDMQYITAPWIREAARKGQIADCGSSMAPAVERIISISPDAVFLSPMQNTGGYGKVENIGVPIIEMADYMEDSPLGRAEWIKFYGLLTGKEKIADRIFENTEKQYLKLSAQAKKYASRPKAIMDKVENGCWYLPGGNSTIARTLRDAGIDYAYAADRNAGGIQKSTESIVSANADAALWLMRYYKAGGELSLGELAGENGAYKLIRAYREGNVYGCNTADGRFFEETPFRPDYLLRDFIIIAHPEAAGLGKTRYFHKLEKR